MSDIVNKLKADLLGGTVDVDTVRSADDQSVLRYLVTTKSARDAFSAGDKVEYDTVYYMQHVQMVTELNYHGYRGGIAFEVPITTLLDYIDSYCNMAFQLLQSQIALHLHVLMVDDVAQFQPSLLTMELSGLAAYGVEIIVEGIVSADHVELATHIWSVVQEVRMDLSAKNAAGYVHLSALLSSSLTKSPRVGVIINDVSELPPFSQTYQLSVKAR